MALKAVVRSVARAVADYELNSLWQIDGPVPEPQLPAGYRFAPAEPRLIDALRQHPDPKTAKAVGYARPGVHAHMVLAVGDAPAAIAFFYGTQTYRKRDIVVLGPGEAALVELVTAPEHRGRGLAPALIAAASNAMFALGAPRLKTWIWWSNTPSVRAFQKAGWRQKGYKLNARVAGVSIRLRLPG